jgi:branched-chain amino acid aminotransferase
MSLAWWNGRIIPPEEVRIAPDDAGFLFGDGLFETLRVDAGRARDLSAHLDRLFAGLLRLGIAPPEDRCALGRAVTDVANAAPRPAARLRITVSRGTSEGPTRLITASVYEPPGEDVYGRGVAAVLLPDHRIDSRGPLAGLKSLGYQANRLALRQAEASGAWDALRLNEHGRLASGSRSNLALVLPEGIFTPPESEGCLPGTVRRRLLEAGAIRERPLTLDDLAAAEGLLLLNSLVGVLPVSSVDDREVPVGPEARKLATPAAQPVQDARER